MKTRIVYKFPLDHNTSVIRLPVGASILHVGNQSEKIMLWVELDSDEKTKEDRTFIIIPTGGAFVATNCSFIGTVLLAGGALVFHIYEVEA